MDLPVSSAASASEGIDHNKSIRKALCCVLTDPDGVAILLTNPVIGNDGNTYEEAALARQVESLNLSESFFSEDNMEPLSEDGNFPTNYIVKIAAQRLRNAVAALHNDVPLVPLDELPHQYLPDTMDEVSLVHAGIQPITTMSRLGAIAHIQGLVSAPQVVLFENNAVTEDFGPTAGLLELLVGFKLFPRAQAREVIRNTIRVRLRHRSSYAAFVTTEENPLSLPSETWQWTEGDRETEEAGHDVLRTAEVIAGSLWRSVENALFFRSPREVVITIQGPAVPELDLLYVPTGAEKTWIENDHFHGLTASSLFMFAVDAANVTRSHLPSAVSSLLGDTTVAELQTIAVVTNAESVPPEGTRFDTETANSIVQNLPNFTWHYLSRHSTCPQAEGMQLFSRRHRFADRTLFGEPSDDVTKFGLTALCERFVNKYNKFVADTWLPAAFHAPTVARKNLNLVVDFFKDCQVRSDDERGVQEDERGPMTQGALSLQHHSDDDAEHPDDDATFASHMRQEGSEDDESRDVSFLEDAVQSEGELSDPSCEDGLSNFEQASSRTERNDDDDSAVSSARLMDEEGNLLDREAGSMAVAQLQMALAPLEIAIQNYDRVTARSSASDVDFGTLADLNSARIRLSEAVDESFEQLARPVDGIQEQVFLSWLKKCKAVIDDAIRPYADRSVRAHQTWPEFYSSTSMPNNLLRMVAIRCLELFTICQSDKTLTNRLRSGIPTSTKELLADAQEEFA